MGPYPLFCAKLFFVCVCGAALSNMVASNYIWPFKFKLIKIKQNLKFTSSVTLTISQVLDKPHVLVAAVLGNTERNISNVVSSSIGHHQFR